MLDSRNASSQLAASQLPPQLEAVGRRRFLQGGAGLLASLGGVFGVSLARRRRAADNDRA